MSNMCVKCKNAECAMSKFAEKNNIWQYVICECETSRFVEKNKRFVEKNKSWQRAMRTRCNEV